MILSVKKDANLSAREDIMVLLLVLLDMSAAFDTVDHEILHNILDRRSGVQSNALAWFSSYLTSYLTGRTQSVCVSASISDPATLKCGVPQGSALGPVEFIVYTEELQDTIDVDYHLYADDIQLLARMQVADVDAKREAMCCVHQGLLFSSQTSAEPRQD